MTATPPSLRVSALILVALISNSGVVWVGSSVGVADGLGFEEGSSPGAAVGSLASGAGFFSASLDALGFGFPAGFVSAGSADFFSAVCFLSSDFLATSSDFVPVSADWTADSVAVSVSSGVGCAKAAEEPKNALALTSAAAEAPAARRRKDVSVMGLSLQGSEKYQLSLRVTWVTLGDNQVS
ncbi:hypothetical protein [Brevibacterium luteolum]|uniref:hypothetical protein n=1 Tax=Brevibacterium luteolum TaxID=199591 RepID=UPI00223B267F|nr:hypothetical protein [Brevibacterium luteolum]